MIRQIKKIARFGVYSDFTWDSKICADFKQYNFIYGWNYSGKTTLSRLFRCFELKNIHPDFPNLECRIQTDQGELTHKNLADHALNIRVFNEDFVEENFKWNDENHRLNPVFILGAEAIELNEQLKRLTDEKNQQDEILRKLQSEKNNLELKLDNTLTNKASEIRKILSITNARELDKTRLESQISKIKENYKEKIFSEADRDKKLSIYRNQRQYENIAEIKIDLKSNQFIQECNQLLSKKITAQQVIEKLKENPQLNNWVREGLRLHQQETICQFCGNPIPEDLFDKLNKHFSKEFDQLIEDIQSLESEIRRYKIQLEKLSFPDKAYFYEEYQEEYVKRIQGLKNCISDLIGQLDQLTEKLEEKKKKPFDIVNSDFSKPLDDDIVQAINKINELIQSNNKKIQGLSKEKEKIKEELIQYYSAYAIDETTYFTLKKEIEDKTKEIAELEARIQELTKQIESKREEILKCNLGSEKINRYLNDFFGDDHLRIKPLDDGKYQIFRGNTLAKNLSTGERNIIALVYFITKLEENNFAVNQAIVFIDDPVSSLDSNHTYKVYGFLQEKLKDCGQLFISTHNFDFFNLLKDLVYGDPDGTPNKKKKSEKENYYLIKKILQNGGKISRIENLPDILRRFRSEYNYLFSILMKFADSNDQANFEMLYILPNIARRFLEAYLFYKYPDGKVFKDKCKLFFQSVEQNKKQTVLKLLDEYSHEENPEHIRNHPDIQELHDCIRVVFELLQNNDKEHYDALCESVK
ncbi:MAG: AAA family ATPase [Brevinematia bacterium]